jgi:4,5-DOPA dioxygenase extradiol
MEIITMRMPVLFVAHGNPLMLDLPHRMQQLTSWGQALPRPNGVVVISAHWQSHPVTLGASSPTPLIYDFYGFPNQYYQRQYSTPPATQLAARMRQLLQSNVAPYQEQPERGFDHGVWVPLIGFYPEADIPVLQLSLPSEDPQTLLELGKVLAPLRDEGILILTSGYLTHNLRQWTEDGVIAPWAAEFDTWIASRLLEGDRQSLIQYQQLAPGVRQSVPTPEHLVPLFVAMGASTDADGVSFPITGFEFGSFSHRSVQFG